MLRRPTFDEPARLATLAAARHRAGILTHRERLRAYYARHGAR